MIPDPGLGHFVDHVGEAFEVDADGERFDLILDSAAPLGHSLRPGGSFVLQFRGPRDPILPQATYAVRRGGDRFDIFIVPLGPDANGARYEAIFN